MKKLYLFVTLLLCANFSFAEVLLVEDFDYQVGEYLTSHDWFTQWGAAGELMTTTGLGFEGYADCGIGSAALFDTHTSQPLHKSLSKEVSSGDVYVAFMLQPKWASKNAYFLALRDKITDNYTFNMNGRVYIDENNKIGLTFSKDKIKCVQYDEPLAEDKIYLIVLKYHIVAGNNNDEVSLYILNKFAATEPVKPSIGPVTDKSYTDISPASVQLHCDHGDGTWFTLDGIRVATTWQEAVATGTCPSDAYLNPDNDWGKTTDLDLLSTVENTESFELYNALGTYLGTYREMPQLQHGIYLVRKGNKTHKINL